MNNKRHGQISICICGKIVYRQPFHKNKFAKVFCSRQCSHKGKMNQIEKLCKTCGVIYKTHPSQVKHRGSNYCSKKCFAVGIGEFMRTLKRKRGNKSHAWKNGSSYKKSLWIIFSKYIRQRDKGICFSCGKKDDWKKMDAGHYIPKSAGLSLYFDEKNVNCQCTYCNRWMHGNLSQYALALRKKYGDSILEELEWKRRQITKISVMDYQQMIELYKKKLIELNKI